MLYKIRKNIKQSIHAKACVSVLDTAPLEMVHDNVTILSQLQTSDVIAYLVALKSFYTQFKKGRVVIVSDGTLTEADQELLHKHIPLLEVQQISDYWRDDLPRGGTWERLIAIDHHRREDYVMQLDADTVTLGPVQAVLDRVATETPFALIDEDSKGYQNLANTSAYAKQHKADQAHVQDASEFHMEKLLFDHDAHYVCGTSAFAGFPKGESFLPLLVSFSNQMQEILGQRWEEWGTEQISSNFIVANLDKPAKTLPTDLFKNHKTETDLDGASFVHFFGTYRHYRARYTRYSKRAIQML